MFISLEGIEGAGKSTLIKALCTFFEQNNKEVLVTREPGGSELGKKLRSIVLNTNEKICPKAELFLFLADRAQHIQDVISPALAEGKIVLCDRYVDSTIAYQGYGRGMDIDLLENLNKAATNGLLPHITFLLDLPPDTGLKRANSRNHLHKTAHSEGRFEAEEMSFHSKIREGFLERARNHTQRFIILDATQKPSTVSRQAIAALITKQAHQ